MASPARAMDIAKTEDVSTLHKWYVLPVLLVALLMDITNLKAIDVTLIPPGVSVLLIGTKPAIVRRA